MLHLCILVFNGVISGVQIEQKIKQCKSFFQKARLLVFMSLTSRTCVSSRQLYKSTIEPTLFVQ